MCIRHIFSQSPSKDRINTPSPLQSGLPLDNWADINDFDDIPPLSPASVRKALPLMKWPDRRSQQKRLVLSEDPDPTPEEPTRSAVTRARRGLTTKSFKQARLESQKGHNADLKAQRAVKRREAIARKQAKMMKPGKEDVSQLTERLRSSSL